MTGSTPRQARLVAALAAMAFALLGAPALPARAAAPAAPASAPAAASESPSRPNVLVLVSDDQAWSTFGRDVMPNLYERVIDQGVLFPEAHVNTSLCCPSRAQILTGLYGHHNGVDANLVTLAKPTIAEALHDSGYSTILAGKYLNSETCAPRGEFDHWLCGSASDRNGDTGGLAYVDPVLNQDGVESVHSGYMTDVLADYIVDAVGTVPSDQPFFAFYTPRSPHMPANDPRCADLPVAPYRPPSYDEDTMTSGKPTFVRRLPLTTAERNRSDENFTSMTRAATCLDASIGRLLDGLGPRLDDTLVVYVSDNGYLYGEHRATHKLWGYEESTRVPFAVRYPALVPVDQPRVSDALASNVDIAPTIAELAGIPWGADGRSLVPVLADPGTPFRDAVLIEYCEGETFPCQQAAGQPTEFHYPNVASFFGIVTAQHSYLRYFDGQRELYDLDADPYQLVNLAGTPEAEAVEATLGTQLDAAIALPPPETTIASVTPDDVLPRLVRFRYFSQSRAASYQCRLDHDAVEGAWQACNGENLRLGPLADGAYDFLVQATDASGAIDPTPAVRSFSIATTGPAVEVTSVPPVESNERTATIEFTSPVPDAVFECRHTAGGSTGDWAPCTSGVVLTDLAPAAHDVEIRATDPVDSSVTDPPAHVRFRVGLLGPSVVADARPAKTTASLSASFVFHAIRPTSIPTTCAVDEVPLDCAAGRVDLTGLTEGPHVLDVTATDLGGRSATTPLIWTVDTTPPTGVVEGPKYVHGAPAEFRLTTSEPVSERFCHTDREPLFTPCRSPWHLELPGGAHTVEMTGRDAAGHSTGVVRNRFITSDDQFSYTKSTSARIAEDGDGPGESSITLPEGPPIDRLGVVVEWAHPQAGQTRFTLTHGLRSVVLLDGVAGPDGTGACTGADGLVLFRDGGAGGPASEGCDTAAKPAVFGELIPFEALSAFDGVASVGRWTLHAEDLTPDGSDGTIHSWHMVWTPRPVLHVVDDAVVERDVTRRGAVEVRLSGPVTVPVTVSYATVDGNAVAPGDYAARAGSFVLKPGETSKLVKLGIAGDTLDEPRESFSVAFTTSSPAVRVADGTALVRIKDDDPAPTVTLGDVTVSEPATESDTAVASFTAQLSAPSGREVSFTYATADGTAGASDYDSATGTVTIPAGAVEATIDVVVRGDDLSEGPEQFAVALADFVNVDAPDPDATATITDDDPLPTLSVDDVEVTEPVSPFDTTVATFTLRLSEVGGRDVTFAYATADGTAGLGDYDAAGGTATIPAGSLETTVDVTVYGDVEVEGDEQFTLTATDLVHADPSDTEGTGVIHDEDTLLPPFGALRVF